jgi:hypothetical protein
MQRTRHRSRPPQSNVHLTEVIDEEDYLQDGTPDPVPRHMQVCLDAFNDDQDVPSEAINACVTTEVEEDWFLDSGASSHVTGNSQLLSHVTPSSIPQIRTAGGQIMPVSGQGTVHITDSSGKIKLIHNVLYVPSVKTNLFSVGRLTDIGYRVFVRIQAMSHI